MTQNRSKNTDFKTWRVGIRLNQEPPNRSWEYYNFLAEDFVNLGNALQLPNNRRDSVHQGVVVAASVPDPNRPVRRLPGPHSHPLYTTG